MTAAQPFIHFWCRSDDARGVDGWDPDSQPHRFSTTVGRTVIELYVRLRRAGVSVALGEEIERRPDLIVVSAQSLWRDRGAAKRFLLNAATARAGYLLIRSDIPGWWHLPVPPAMEVVPNGLVARGRNQVCIPELPQRGLRPRAAPIDRIETVAIKCNPENLPPELSDTTMMDGLRRAGATLWIDAPRETSGPDQRWHDYRTVDAALCARRQGPSTLLWKPAGKLINSWVAGCIPIAAREPAYLEIGRHGVDTWFIDSVRELPAAVRALNESSALIRRLEEGVRAKQDEYRPGRVLEQWRFLIEATATSSVPTAGSSPWRRASISLWKVRALHRGARVRNRVWGTRDELITRRRIAVLG